MNHHATTSDHDEAEMFARDLGWNMFEHSANQRMTMIRFYLTATGGIATGIGYLWQAKLALAALLLSVLGVIAAWCFLRLDYRTSDLVKLGELSLQLALRRQHHPTEGDTPATDPFQLGSDLEKNAEKFNGSPYNTDIGLELYEQKTRRRFPYTYDDNICVLLKVVIFAFIVAAIFCLRATIIQIKPYFG